MDGCMDEGRVASARECLMLHRWMDGCMRGRRRACAWWHGCDACHLFTKVP